MKVFASSCCNDLCFWGVSALDFPVPLSALDVEDASKCGNRLADGPDADVAIPDLASGAESDKIGDNGGIVADRREGRKELCASAFANITIFPSIDRFIEA
jgi:hypothetical protein